MSYVETVERLRKLKEGQGGELTKPTKDPSVSFVSPEGGPFSDFEGADEGVGLPQAPRCEISERPPPGTDKTDKRPREPCPACGSGAFYQAERGGPWRCWGCHPPAHGPVALITVPGGRVPEGEPQDAAAVLAEVAAAAGVSVARLKAALSAEDLDDIAAGRVGARELRAFAEHLLGVMHGDDGGHAA